MTCSLRRSGPSIGDPALDPEWTWMTEGQAALVLKAHGYDFIFNIERAGQFWRGKAMRDGLPSLCRQVAFFTSGHSFFTGSGEFFAIVRTAHFAVSD